ncbi:MAG: diphosphomevalonate decarboxylase [Deltaproteobacteria bacterium]|nr:diphosphomevalonate decarboxylase [Deltaproteobacteria bacterium]
MSLPTRRAAAFAPSNIALTKYWGKRDARLNLPLAPSVSVALAELGSLTIVQPDADLAEDVMVVDDQPLDDAGMVKVRRVLDQVRQRSGSRWFAGLRSVNTVPPARGLASSASAFAALATAAAEAYGLALTPAELSALARSGSGSASRSTAGGFALWHKGERDDGSDSFAEQVFAPEHWPLRVLVARVEAGRKAVSSTRGMALADTSAPFFRAWIEQCDRDVPACLDALAHKHMRSLAEVVEGNALAMHATMLAGRPPLVYWQPATVGVIHTVRQLRAEGAECCFTIDAGSSVVVLVEPQDARPVADALAAVDGIEEVIQTRIGAGARLLSSGEA